MPLLTKTHSEFSFERKPRYRHLEYEDQFIRERFDLAKSNPKPSLSATQEVSMRICLVRPSYSQLEIGIRHLVEEGNISQARNELAKIPARASLALDKWKRILAEPKGKLERKASGSRLKPNLVWLRNNSDQYKGQWVALREGTLLGNHASRSALRANLKRLDQLKGALFFKVEE